MALSSLSTNWIKGSYEADRDFLLKVAENNPLRLGTDLSGLSPHWDTKDSIALGYGLDLLTNSSDKLRTYLAAIGITLTAEAEAVITSARDTRDTLRGLKAQREVATDPAVQASLDTQIAAEESELQTQAASLAGQGIQLQDEAQATDLLHVVEKDKTDDLERTLGSDMPADSHEKAVLVSMWFQTPAYFRNAALQDTSLTRAIRTDDRAEAWYEIRYGSSAGGKDGAGVVKRRFFESDYFGLYKDGSFTDEQLDAEAKSVLQMYTRHREKILNYEAKFGVNPDGSPGSKGNMIAASEAIYGADIDTLSESLESARNRIIATEVTARGVIRAIDGEVLIGQDLDYVTPTKTYSKNDTTTLVGKDKNDLILGGAGNDRLDGGAGDDVLIGGAGVDTYVIEGNDIIVDSGLNWIVYNGQLVSKVFGDNGSGTTFVADDGSNLTFHSPGRLTLSANDSVTFQNQTGAAAFADHDFGIYLRDAVSDPLPGVTTEGDGDNNNLAGTTVIDWMAGNGGRDLIQGGDGADVLFADALADLPAGPDYGGATPYADAVGDFVNGGADNDIVVGSTLSDALLSGTGGDFIVAGAGHDIVYGDGTYEILGATLPASAPWWTWRGQTMAYPAADESSPTWGITQGLLFQTGTVSGVADSTAGGDDVIYGGTGGDWVLGGYGNDIVYGEAGMDSLDGGAGSDALYGGDDDDALDGDLNADPATHGDDFLDLGTGQTAQSARGGGGADIILGADTNDYLEGDERREGYDGSYHGNDFIDAKGGNDRLWGEGGADTLVGGAGNDYLQGDAEEFALAAIYHGDDWLDGGDGDDTLRGDGGNDTLFGGVLQPSTVALGLPLAV